MLLKNCFIASSLSTLFKSMQKSSKNRPKMSNTNVKAKTTMFFDIATEKTEKTNFFGNCQWDSLLHRFCALILFFVKALRQWWRIREAMKRWTVNYGKKLKQWSDDEAFNAGKEIEAMKRLTLLRIASSLHRFIASVAQLCSTVVTLVVILVEIMTKDYSRSLYGLWFSTFQMFISLFTCC